MGKKSFFDNILWVVETRNKKGIWKATIRVATTRKYGRFELKVLKFKEPFKKHRLTRYAPID